MASGAREGVYIMQDGKRVWVGETSDAEQRIRDHYREGRGPLLDFYDVPGGKDVRREVEETIIEGLNNSGVDVSTTNWRCQSNRKR